MSVSVMDFIVEVETGQISKGQPTGLASGASWKALAKELKKSGAIKANERITQFHVTQQGLRWVIE